MANVRKDALFSRDEFLRHWRDPRHEDHLTKPIADFVAKHKLPPDVGIVIRLRALGLCLACGNTPALDLFCEHCDSKLFVKPVRFLKKYVKQYQKNLRARARYHLIKRYWQHIALGHSKPKARKYALDFDRPVMPPRRHVTCFQERQRMMEQARAVLAIIAAHADNPSAITLPSSALRLGIPMTHYGQVPPHEVARVAKCSGKPSGVDADQSQ